MKKVMIFIVVAMLLTSVLGSTALAANTFGRFVVDLPPESGWGADISDDNNVNLSIPTCPDILCGRNSLRKYGIKAVSNDLLT